jgi:RNA methyltransferase, TrmH family
MNEPLLIQSRNNPRIKSIVGLKEAKGRRASGLFTVEGLHEVQTAVGYHYPIKELYCEESIYPSIAEQLVDYLSIWRCFLVSQYVFEKLSNRQNPDGVIAVCEQQPIRSICDVESFERPLLILDQLENPGNLGAILRSCAAFGVKDIILDDNALDPYNPNVIRNSRGHSLGLTIYRNTKEDTFKWLSSNHFESFIVSPDSKQDVATIKVGLKSAFILGNEHHGVSQFWKENAKKEIQIPMTGIVDSLNVSVSASIVLYEVFKQLKSND